MNDLSALAHEHLGTDDLDQAGKRFGLERAHQGDEGDHSYLRRLLTHVLGAAKVDQLMPMRPDAPSAPPPDEAPDEKGDLPPTAGTDDTGDLPPAEPNQTAPEAGAAAEEAPADDTDANVAVETPAAAPAVDEIADGRLPPEIWVKGDDWYPSAVDGSTRYVEVPAGAPSSLRLVTPSRSDPTKKYSQRFAEG